MFFSRGLLGFSRWNGDVVLPSQVSTYTLAGPVPVFDHYTLHEATSELDNRRVLIKCVPVDQLWSMDAELFNRIDIIHKASEKWAPMTIEDFLVTWNYMSLGCLVLESVEWMSDQLPIEDLGLKMLSITETLHKKYNLNHRHALASNWGFTEDGRFVLANFAGLESTKKFDNHGYHRVRELHQLGLTLRYLVDSDERFMDLNTIESTDPEFICSNVCGPKLRRLIENLFAIHEDRGDVPNHMYTSMRASLLSMIDGDAFSYHGYRDLEWVGRGGSASLMSAQRDNSGERVVLKCSGKFAEEDIGEEYDILSGLRDESWVPKVIEFFTVSEYNLRCYSMEKLGVSLVDYESLMGVITNPQLGQLGVRMTSIIQSLHQEHGLCHGSVRAKNWMLRDANDLASLVLIDFGKAAFGNDQLYLKDVREIPLTLRYIMNPSKVFSSAKKIRRVSMEEIGDSCPELLNDTIMYTLALENLDANIYSYLTHNFQLIQ
jgi:hypothetical protein